MNTVCSARVIFESDLMQDFLQIKESGGGATASNATPHKERKVDLRVMLPDNTVISIPISEHWRTAEVLAVWEIDVCVMM